MCKQFCCGRFHFTCYNHRAWALGVLLLCLPHSPKAKKLTLQVNRPRTKSKCITCRYRQKSPRIFPQPTYDNHLYEIISANFLAYLKFIRISRAPKTIFPETYEQILRLLAGWELNILCKIQKINYILMK